MDECLGGHTIAAALREAGIDVRIPGEHGGVPRGLSDPDWAKSLAGRGWVPVTRDKHIRHRAPEKQAIADAKLGLFVLASRQNLTGPEIIDLVRKAAPKMGAFLKKHDPPFIANIYRNGEIKLRENL